MIEISKLFASIQEALTLVRTLRGRSSEAFLKSIEDELLRIQELARSNWPLRQKDIDTLWLGPFAVRNLEDLYPDLATLLKRIHYLCKADVEPL